jgi:hypothetical protein
VVDDTVFVGSNDNHLYALDASSGEEQWRFQTGKAVQSSPAVVDDTVFVGSDDNSIYALTGTDRGVTHTPTPSATARSMTSPSPPGENRFRLVQLGALGTVGTVVGFFVGNAESEHVKGNALALIAALLGGGGLLRLVIEGGSEVSLFVIALGLSVFLGVLVGIAFRNWGFTIGSSE